MLVSMNSWPFIKLIREVEHFAVEKWTESKTFLQEDWEILSEQEETNVIVLVFYDVIYDCLDSP